ncbi:MAG TPA: hypothetical protein VLG50_07430 [Candidatus Saccharimonadales bacterium]|nr:hypothetical protein [Candidatus Saccharimonadales bacterium]
MSLPFIIPSDNTYTGIRNAINQASLNPNGGTILLESKDYIDDQSGHIVINHDDIHIVGTAGTKIIAPATGDMTIFSSSIKIYTPLILTNNVNQFDNTIDVFTTSNIQERSYILINKTLVPNVIVWSLICYITKINGNRITITPFIPFDINLSDQYNIVPIKLLNNISISNITFDGNHNTSITRAMRLNGISNGKFEHIKLIDFNGSAGIFIDQGFSNYINHIDLENCGNINEGDAMFSYQTNSTITNVRSLNASGFGPMFIRCNFCQISNLSSLSATYRGIKFLGSLFCQCHNVQSHISQTVGIALTFGSQYNQFTNCCACCHYDINNPINSDGLWTSGHENNNNVINGGVFLNNTTADIFIDPLDHDNVVINSIYNTKYQGCCNCSNKVYPNILNGFLKRTFKTMFGCCH